MLSIIMDARVRAMLSTLLACPLVGAASVMTGFLLIR
jgi:hypothetical protein